MWWSEKEEEFRKKIGEIKDKLVKGEFDNQITSDPPEISDELEIIIKNSQRTFIQCSSKEI